MVPSQDTSSLWFTDKLWTLLPATLIFSLLALFTPATPRLVNVTIDDQLGDSVAGFIPLYSPDDGTWHAGNPFEDCTTCKIVPSTFDLSQVNSKTWHDATYLPFRAAPQVIANFTGSAVYVYNILLNNLTDNTVVKLTNLSFTIDDQEPEFFTHSPDPNSDTILYNQLVYSNTALENGPHSLSMAGTGDSATIVLFDYLVYTTEADDVASTPVSSASPTSSSSPTIASSSTSSSSGKRVGVIVGAVIGGVALIVAISGIGVFFLRRRRARAFPARRYPGLLNGELEGSKDVEGSSHGTSTDSVSGYGDGECSWYICLLRVTFVHPPILARPSSSRFTKRTMSGVVAVSTPPAGGDGVNPATPAPQSTEVEPARRGRLVATGGAARASKRREELTQRLETLQRQMSTLSSPTGANRRSGAQAESENRVARRVLEEEVARLRGALASVSAQLAEERRNPEPLPAYGE